MTRNSSGTRIAALVTHLLTTMLFFSLRPYWSGLGSMAGIKQLPALLMAVLVALLILSAIQLRRKRRRGIVLLIAGALLLGGLVYMITRCNLPIVLAEFGITAGFTAAVTAVGLLIWKCPAGKRPLKGIKTVLIALVAVAAFCAFYGIGAGGVKDKPAVFAVEDSYQIVFTTRADALGWVTVGGVDYHDTYNGSARSETTVHKISVPMAALDKAGGYEIHAQTVLYRGPYGGIKGTARSLTFAFYPVDASDGIQYYAVSDTHDYTAAGIETARYFGDALDFLILTGDHASFLNHEADLRRALVIANGVTGGSHPVVYARGNHEVKGNRAEELHRSVGADGDRFYYTFRLGPVWGVVLDMGEDHADDWWEFYGTAQFDAYRRDQLAFLNELNKTKPYADSGVQLRIAICHVPIAHPGSEYLGAVRQQILDALNAMKPDYMISGHTHTLEWIPAGEQGAEFLTVVDSQKADTTEQGSDEYGRRHTGLAVVWTAPNKSVLTYTNSKHETVAVTDPRTGSPIDGMTVFGAARE